MFTLLSFLGCHPGHYCWILRLSDKELLNILSYDDDYKHKRQLALVCRRFHDLLQHSLAWEQQKAIQLQLEIHDIDLTVGDSLASAMIRRHITPVIPGLARYLPARNHQLIRRVFGSRVVSSTDFMRHIQFCIDNCRRLRRLEFTSLDAEAALLDKSSISNNARRRYSKNGTTERELISLENETLKMINRALPMNKLRAINVSLCDLQVMAGLSQAGRILDLIDHQHVSLMQCNLFMQPGRWPAMENDRIGEQRRLLSTIRKCTKLRQLGLSHLHADTADEMIKLLQGLPNLTTLAIDLDVDNTRMAAIINSTANEDGLECLQIRLKLDGPENFWIGVQPTRLDQLNELTLIAETGEVGGSQALTEFGDLLLDWLNTLNVDRIITIALNTVADQQCIDSILASLENKSLCVRQLKSDSSSNPDRSVIEVCNSAFGPHIRMAFEHDTPRTVVDAMSHCRSLQVIAPV